METQDLPANSAVHIEQIHPVGGWCSIYHLLLPGMDPNGPRKLITVLHLSSSTTDCHGILTLDVRWSCALGMFLRG